MTTQLIHGDCITELKKLPDKSVDLFIMDLPYNETNCAWDKEIIDLKEFWIQFKRIRKSKRTACIHFCSTKFGYKLIQSNEKMFKMDMVWKKRNKTGGLCSRFRPMRNHEMVYFFYEQAPKYNRDKYHKRINNVKHADSDTTGEKKAENIIIKREAQNFKPIQPSSVLEEKKDFMGETKSQREKRKNARKALGTKHIKDLNDFDPPNPASVYESEKCWVGKRNHQTEKPLDILHFFLKYWSCEGDIICDPTMGSGSTGVACKELNRSFIGIELDDEIFKIAEKRINNN